MGLLLLKVFPFYLMERGRPTLPAKHNNQETDLIQYSYNHYDDMLPILRDATDMGKHFAIIISDNGPDWKKI